MDHGIVSQWEGLLEVISASMEEMKVEPERHPVLLTEVGLNGYVSVMNWVCLKIGGGPHFRHFHRGTNDKAVDFQGAAYFQTKPVSSTSGHNLL